VTVNGADSSSELSTKHYKTAYFEHDNLALNRVRNKEHLT